METKINKKFMMLLKEEFKKSNENPEGRVTWDYK